MTLYGRFHVKQRLLAGSMSTAPVAGLTSRISVG
jgi:hypothetical protein